MGCATGWRDEGASTHAHSLTKKAPHMQSNRTRELIAIGAALSALTGCAAAPAADDTVNTSSSALKPRGVTQDPRAKSADWPSAGHDWHHTGHNAGEKQIKRDNVAQLGVKWQHSFAPNPAAPEQKIPVVSVAVAAEGVAYIADMGGFVHARKLSDGSPVWTSYVSAAPPDPIFSSVVQAGSVVTEDALYIGDSDATIFKIDRDTGAVEWSTQVETNPEALIQGDLATVGSHLVFGVSSFENATVLAGDLTMRGSVVSLDKDDGTLEWQTFTTSDQSAALPRFGAGAGVWSSPAIDATTGHLFIGTGQHYEQPNLAAPADPACEGAGPLLGADCDFSDSILSVSMEDGAIDARRQFTQGDVFGKQFPNGPDFDVGTPPNLFDVNLPGCGKVPAVGVGDKEGTYYVMRRDTLEILWSKRIAFGSVLGGFQATGAYANGVIYVAAHEYMDGTSLQSVIPPGQSASFLGTPEGFNTVQKLSKTNIFALRARDGKPLWKKEVMGAITFAPLVLANDILFQGDVNGGLRAFDTRNGNVLWEAQLGGIFTGPGGYVAGNMITGLSLSRGRLMVSSLPLLPDSPSGVTAYGLPE